MMQVLRRWGARTDINVNFVACHRLAVSPPWEIVMGILNKPSFKSYFHPFIGELIFSAAEERAVQRVMGMSWDGLLRLRDEINEQHILNPQFASTRAGLLACKSVIARTEQLKESQQQSQPQFQSVPDQFADFVGPVGSFMAAWWLGGKIADGIAESLGQ